MEDFTLTFGRAWWSRVVGHNPLVRRGDRVAAWASIITALVIAAAAPIAGFIATSVHDSRTQTYAEQAESSHQVSATALEDSKTTLGPGPADVSFVVRAEWRLDGRHYSDVVDWQGRAKVGDRQGIWVDEQGRQVQQPPSSESADNDAVAIGFTLWFAVMSIAIAIAYFVSWRVDCHHDAGWERDLDTLNHHRA